MRNDITYCYRNLHTISLPFFLCVLNLVLSNSFGKLPGVQMCKHLESTILCKCFTTIKKQDSIRITRQHKPQSVDNKKIM